MTATLLGELERRGERYGVASMCVGFGQAIAAVIERVDGTRADSGFCLRCTLRADRAKSGPRSERVQDPLGARTPDAAYGGTAYTPN